MYNLRMLFNKAGGLKIIKQYLLTGMWWRAPLILTTSGTSLKGLEIFRLVANLCIYKYIKKKYWHALEMIDYSKYSPEHNNSNKVWICWFQGMENAPLVVRRCYESMKANLKNEEVILLTDNNIKDYVHFPEYILGKYERGVITKTHFTDLLRLELLINYGGTWIDSTVLCTGEIPDFIKQSELFLYRELKPGLDGHSIALSSWFIESTTNNKVLIAVREMLYDYWKKNNTLIDYFLLHIFLQLALEKYPEEEAKMVKVSNSTPHILLLDIFKPYNKFLYEAIKKQTPIHKLAYKRSKEEMEKRGTYFDEIINKGNIL